MIRQFNKFRELKRTKNNLIGHQLFFREKRTGEPEVFIGIKLKMMIYGET